MRGAETLYQHIRRNPLPDATKQDILALTSTLVRSIASAEIADCTADVTLARLSELQGMSPPWQTHNEDEEENAQLKNELQTLWATFGCAIHRLMVRDFTGGKQPASSSERQRGGALGAWSKSGHQRSQSDRSMTQQKSCSARIVDMQSQFDNAGIARGQTKSHAKQYAH